MVFRGNTLEADHPCAQARTKGIGVFKNQDSNPAALTDLHAIGQATPIDLVHPTDPVVSTAQGGNASSFLSLAFSPSSSFSRFASDTSMPPNLARHF